MQVIRFLIFAYENELQARSCDLCKVNVTPQYQKITPLRPLKDKNQDKKHAKGPRCNTRLSYYCVKNK